MDAKAMLDYLRELCGAIDAGRPPDRRALRRVVGPLAVPAAVGLVLGAAGCGTHTALDVDSDIPAGCEPTPELCEDGVDNDGNGATDCDDLCCDAFCFARDCPYCLYGIPFEPAASETACDDAFDDDCDGLTDCCDPDCGGDPACADSGD